jgi:hypothetical protein
MGGGYANENHPIFKSHSDGVKVEISIQAVIVVKDRIITGICFPKHEVENQFPHVTMLVKKWKRADSNAILEATCRPGKAFHKVYKQMESGNVPEAGVWESDFVQIKGEAVKAYFVVLEKPFVFEAVTKSYNG